MKTIKKSLLVLIALLVTTFSGVSFADSPPETTFQSAQKKMMAGQEQGTPTRILKLVRYASGDPSSPSTASGDAVTYSLISDDGVTIAYTATSADGAIAGILATIIESADGTSVVAQDDAGRRNWGWMVVHGPMTGRSVAGGTNAHSAGDPFYTSRDAGAITSLETTFMSSDQGGSSNAGLDLLHVNERKAAVSKGGFFMDAADGTTTRWDIFVMLE